MQSSETDNLYVETINIVRAALPQMSKHRIPITPSNYAVWFEYLAEKNEDLRREIEELISLDSAFTSEKMRELYERYITDKGEQLKVAREAVSQLVQALLNQINQADGHFSSFSSTLGEIAEELVSETSTADLSVLIERALEATTAAVEQGAVIKGQLVVLSNEMEGLRNQLERSEELARIDQLTGLQNRLAFREEIDRLCQQGWNDAHTPCLIMIDVDHFKRINDTYGHVAGDAIIQGVATEILRNVRGKDMVARYGGEEFGVLLSDTPRSGCHTVAENIRSSLESSDITLPEEMEKKEPVSVTVSLGGAWLREGESFESFVDRADRALYLSKQDGRNKVTWEGRETEQP